MFLQKGSNVLRYVLKYRCDMMTGICFDILCKEKVGILVHLGGSNDLTTD